MPYTVRVVCRPELARGFQLAGVSTDEARSSSEGIERILELADRPDTGVILVEEALYDALSDSAERSTAWPAHHHTGCSAGPSSPGSS